MYGSERNELYDRIVSYPGEEIPRADVLAIFGSGDNIGARLILYCQFCREAYDYLLEVPVYAEGETGENYLCKSCLEKAIGLFP